MNKKLFILLPTVMLMLAGCGDNPSSDTTGPTSDPTTTTTPTTTITETGGDKAIYGSKEEPLTVAQFLENVEKHVAKVDETFSDYEFFIKGYVKQKATWNDSYSQFNTFNLVDNMGDKKSAKIQKAKDGVGVDAGATLGAGDQVVVRGYAEYYNNSYSIFPGETTPKVSNLVRGTSKVTLSVGEHVKVNEEVKTSYTNGSEVTFTVTVDSGYLPVVTGATKVSDNTFKFDVYEDTTVTVKASLDIAASDLPAGTYSVKMDSYNCGLTTTSTSASAVTELTAKAEEADKKYKGISFTFSKGCNVHASYANEFVVGKGSSLKISAPNGKISSIVLELYKSHNSKVYAADNASGTALTGSTTTATSGGTDAKAYSYDINNADAFINVPSGASYAETFYHIIVNVVVE